MSGFPVFIGWSGAGSKAVASALWNWLPDVLQFVKPWLSEEDIAKGARWSSELADHLLEAQFGIFCLTSENLNSLWIPFEAGCLSRNVKSDRICPYLFLVPSGSTPAPLIQFQVTNANQAETERMIISINEAAGPLGIPVARAKRSFEHHWPAFKAKLDEFEFADLVAPAPQPSSEAILTEILETVRRLGRQELGFNITPKFSRLVGQLLKGQGAALKPGGFTATVKPADLSLTIPLKENCDERSTVLSNPYDPSRWTIENRDGIWSVIDASGNIIHQAENVALAQAWVAEQSG